MSDYAWKIDRDYVEDGTGEYLPPGKGQVIEVHGPRAATEAQIERLNRGEGHAFRLYDDDGGLNLSGRIIYDKPGVVDGFEPLDDYGIGGYGCTEIRFRRPDGSWETL